MAFPVPGRATRLLVVTVNGIDAWFELSAEQAQKLIDGLGSRSK